MADDKPIYEIRFDAAVRVIQSLPRNGPFQPSNDMMLKFYSYYKQATLGPCNIPRPGFWDPVGKVKWDVWNSLGDMPREKAMMAYVDELKLILETIPVTEQVVDLLDVLGPFYEVADDTKGASQTNEEEVSITRLKVEDSSGKAQVLLSNGSVEHSISSMTNGTHSSLNSECTEEELACTLQPPEQTCDINGHLSDHGEEEVTGPLQLASDSDSEVYCDSMEQFGLEEGCGVQINHSLETGEVSHPCRVEQGLLGEAPGRDDPLGGVNGIQHGGEEGTPGNHTPQGERLTAGRHDTSLVRKGRGTVQSQLFSFWALHSTRSEEAGVQLQFFSLSGLCTVKLKPVPGSAFWREVKQHALFGRQSFLWKFDHIFLMKSLYGNASPVGDLVLPTCR